MRTKGMHRMTDEAVLAELGERLARHRLNRNITQAAVAREAGVARRTVSRLENGYSVDTQSLIRILRALDLIEGLDRMVPPARPSPLALAERQGRPRERARARDGDRGEAGDAGGWVWPDEHES